ncbi:uncharacterized protein LOC133743382 isoform X1 [Rosa rugosa]|uniref:uncharacterized protein LOC133743382 isoform X1 n=1 Tax=Rosa rugosa TaxID=74645 RepID=UPI002B4186A4|nr:uncharacterized protein LOC133743382 isoform X1 [Rosa rugosa]
MAEVKRWSVTYTKHMKQKRKVYQDGFLELHTSTNKMLLFDDCEKLLECRILKKDEAVSSGETLTFNAFLVDVNDAESGDGDQKPESGFSSRENDMKFSEKRAKSWNKPQPFQTPAQNIIRGKKPLQNLSPSQNIIKEFKKRELHKYGAALSSPETVTTSTTEWQALYTTQLTQKAKKYHDGFLQLAITGSHGKQIILLDSSRNQLDSRFLKKDEVIASGGSIAFDAHLVDIGEQEGDHKPTDLHRKENKRNIVGEARIKQEQSNGVITGKDDGKEWKVLYTTQVTQKAKKYHDGFLQITSSGSFGRQAMLFDATRKLLETRFLKKDEVISSGESFAFNAHLVDGGEPEGNEAQVDLKSQGKDCHVQKSGILHREDDCIIIDDFELKEWEALYTTQITQKSKKYHVGILRLASSGSFRKKVTLLGEDKTILSNKYVSLSEDIKTGSTLELPKYLVEVGIPRAIAGGEGTTLNKACIKKPSDSRFSISSVEETKLSRGVSRNNPLCDGEENSQNKACSKKALNSSFSISSVEETKPSRGVPTNKLLRDAHQILSFLQNPMAQESVASRQANSTEKPVSSTKGSQVSDAIMVDISEDVRLAESQSSEPHNRSVENKEPGNIMEIGIKAMSSGCGSQLAEGIDIKNSHQLHSDHVEADTARHNRECASDESRSSSCFSHDAADDEKIVSQEPSCARNQENPSFELEFPSFDLGF